MGSNNSLIIAKDIIPKSANKLFISFGVAVAIIIYLYGSIVSIPPVKVGVVFTKIGDASPYSGRFIVEQ